MTGEGHGEAHRALPGSRPGEANLLYLAPKHPLVGASGRTGRLRRSTYVTAGCEQPDQRSLQMTFWNVPSRTVVEDGAMTVAVRKTATIVRCVERACAEYEQAGTGFRQDYTRQDAGMRLPRSNKPKLSRASAGTPQRPAALHSETRSVPQQRH
jgi:hypothetical protein